MRARYTVEALARALNNVPRLERYAPRRSCWGDSIEGFDLCSFRFTKSDEHKASCVVARAF